ncbi:YkvA family protein [Candidatus Spyradosoma sp. SGI.093]|uniref:YkvA family protein n=1 Tax=Candidatus Spyradosoma sp. SGI.093 TaxID=3420583 RepID=UPI003D060F51
MKQLNETDTSRVNAAFDAGRKNVSEKDFDEVLDREEEFNEKGSKLGDMWDNAKLLFQMLKDYKAGKYTDVPWSLIAAIVFAVVYFFSPIDVIPDVIPFLGYVDDVAVFGILLKTFADQIAAYKTWRASASLPPAETK